MKSNIRQLSAVEISNDDGAIVAVRTAAVVGVHHPSHYRRHDHYFSTSDAAFFCILSRERLRAYVIFVHGLIRHEAEVDVGKMDPLCMKKETTKDIKFKQTGITETYISTLIQDLDRDVPYPYTANELDI